MFFFIIVIWLDSDRPSGFHFIHACLIYFFPYSRLWPPFSVSLSYLILSMPMHECLGEYSYTSYTFPIAVLNSPYYFPTTQL